MKDIDSATFDTFCWVEGTYTKRNYEVREKNYIIMLSVVMISVMLLSVVATLLMIVILKMTYF
jgi:hypothetical protein